MKINKRIVKDRRWDILGIGSPLIDIVINIEEELFSKLNIKKGSMNLISAEESRSLLENFKNIKQDLQFGGSTANTLAGASVLGSQVSFSGVIGQDQYGKTYHEEINKEGIGSHLVPLANNITGHCIILITPDGERTMLTHLGVASKFSDKHLKEDEIKNSKILHIEAYQLEGDKTCKAVFRAIKIAKDNNVIISLDLSDVGLIQRNKELFRTIVKDHIDIVFANEEEATEFSGEKNPLKALKKIAENCSITAVKLGAKGSMLKEGTKIFNISPYKTEMINTNGAGDMYAAGILHGIINEIDLQSAGEMSSHISALVVASMGARLDKKHLKSINKYKK